MSNKYRERKERRERREAEENGDYTISTAQSLYAGTDMPRPSVVKQLKVGKETKHVVEAQDIDKLGRDLLSDEIVTTTLVRKKVKLFNDSKKALEHAGFDPIAEAVQHYNECSDMLMKERIKKYPSAGVMSALISSKRAILNDLMRYGYATQGVAKGGEEKSIPGLSIAMDDGNGKPLPMRIGVNSVPNRMSKRLN